MKKWPLALAFALSLGLATPTLANHTSEDPASVETYEALSLFGEIFDKIRHSHVDKQDAQKLIEEAIQGMIKSLDKHSSYVKPAGLEDLQESTSGRYSGIGAEVGWDEEKKGVLIIRPMEGSPAERDGLKVKDVIVEIDGVSLSDLDLKKAIVKIKGPAGTDVKFKVIREGETEPLMITVKRGSIQQKVVRSRIVGDAIMYIRLGQFNQTSDKEMKAALTKLRKMIGDEEAFNGLIIDLRHNPGGLLIQAIEITDMFLDEGLILETRNITSSQKTFAVEGQSIPKNLPIVILINEFSASASEILAGTLQELGRATIIGVKSYGKGSVQTIMPLSNGGAMRLTTAKYYTAGGTSPHGVGITPDIIVTLPEKYWETIPPTERSTHIDPQLKKAIEFLERPIDGNGPDVDIPSPNCDNGNAC